MSPDEFKVRTKAYALRILRLVESLPKTPTSTVLGRQLLRAGTSVGANYRAACRARSRADFIAKLGLVEEECDESLYWMELLVDSKHVERGRAECLAQEGEAILALVVASIKTARRGTSSAIRNPQSASE